VGTWDLLMERIQSIKIYNEWAKYAGFSKQPLTLDDLTGLGKSWIKVFLPKFRIERKKAIARIFNINGSHIEALTEFIKSGIPYGIVLEDDVQIANLNLVEMEIRKLIEFISGSVDFRRSIYVEMSESFTFEQMNAKNLIDLDPNNSRVSLSPTNSVYETKKPFPNTTCSYLLNSEMAKSLLMELNRTWRGRRYRTLPIDWMYLKYFMNLNKNSITNFHVVPGIFKQGSIHAMVKE
jgi:GR25 family glycosyltransferase involved in LPS biosynthesis